MTTAAPAVPAAVPGVSTMSTPRRLRLFMIGIALVSLCLFLAGEGSLARSRAAVKTIGHDTAPSIVAALEISSGLADLDANVANYLIGTGAHQNAALEAVEKRRTQVTLKLVHAANNITYEGEKQPITDMFDLLGRYLELFAEARYRHDNGDTAGAARTYARATELMHTKILIAARDLDELNGSFLARDYKHSQADAGSAESLAIAIGLVLAIGLIYVQIYLYRKMHRVVNPPLLAATLITLGFTWYVAVAIMDARSDLKIAKEDCFDSIYAMWQTRAIAYDANGDESRYLLFPDRQQAYESDFRAKVRKLTSNAMPTDAQVQLMKPQTHTFEGLFANEIANVTFDGELEAATKMIRMFSRYIDIDGRIRQLERYGKHSEAIELAVGSGADESNAMFDRFDAALHEVVTLNHNEFDRTIGKAEEELKRAEWLVPAIAIAIALFGYFGLRPRLREYAS